MRLEVLLQLQHQQNQPLGKEVLELMALLDLVEDMVVVAQEQQQVLQQQQVQPLMMIRI